MNKFEKAIHTNGLYITVKDAGHIRQTAFKQNSSTLTVSYKKDADSNPVVTGFRIEESMNSKRTRFDYLDAKGMHQGHVSKDKIRPKKMKKAESILNLFLKNNHPRWSVIEDYDLRAVTAAQKILQQANKPT